MNEDADRGRNSDCFVDVASVKRGSGSFKESHLSTQVLSVVRLHGSRTPNVPLSGAEVRSTEASAPLAG